MLLTVVVQKPQICPHLSKSYDFGIKSILYKAIDLLVSFYYPD